MLLKLLEEAGCCINERYNHTADEGNEYNWLSYRFWAECGLVSPGHCMERLTGGASVTLYTKTSSYVQIAVIATVAVLILL